MTIVFPEKKKSKKKDRKESGNDSKKINFPLTGRPKAGQWLAVDHVYWKQYLATLEPLGLTLGEMKQGFQLGDQVNTVNGWYEIIKLKKEVSDAER
jgi:hypothetical protein